MKLFNEEQIVLDVLLTEWYDSIRQFTKQADGIFSERAKTYDRDIAPWESLSFPQGLAHEVYKKINRVKQHLSVGTDGGIIDWDSVHDELLDITNYARMLGAMIMMVWKREGGLYRVDDDGDPLEDLFEVDDGLFDEDKEDTE